MTILKSEAMSPPSSRKRHYHSISYFNEAGRSLTEMMGTLAIMGILAIAGIWMYNSAMDRLKANTIINEAQKRAVVVAGQIGFQGRTDPSLGEFSDNEFAGGTFSTNVITDGLYQQFGIQVSNVPKAVCQNILNSIGDGTAIRRLSATGNPREVLNGCGDENTFLMIYNNNLSTGCASNSDCKTECGTCQLEEGICIGECNDVCDNQSDCGTNPCMVCDSVTHTCKDECKRIEYLESTGTQYIDTGLSMPNGYRASMNLAVTYFQAPQIFLGTENYSQPYQMNYFGIKTSNYYYLLGAYSNQMSSVQLLDNDFHQIEVSTIVTKRNAVVDGEEVISLNNTSTPLTLNTVAVFCCNRGKVFAYCSKIKLKYLKLYDSTNMLVRDFIPVLVPQGNNTFKPALFDRVNHEVYYNQGTGADFNYGAVID